MLVISAEAVFCKVIGLPLISVDSDAEGVSRSESPSPSLPSLPASTIAGGGLKEGGWRCSLECSERPLLTSSSSGWVGRIDERDSYQLILSQSGSMYYYFISGFPSLSMIIYMYT